MTLTMAWTRKTGSTEQLIIASDSRLRSLGAWDAAPKIMPLPRGDCAIAFAGDTDYAYPMMIQIVNAINSQPASIDRRISLEHLRGKIIRMINLMLEQQNDVPPGLKENPDAFFLLAGFDWRSDAFKIWTLHFSPNIAKFTFKPAKPWGADKLIAIVGDHLPEVKAILVEMLRDRRGLRPGYFDMEPLRVLAHMIDSTDAPSIGGNIQLVKIYRSIQCVPFVVSRNDKRSLLGRPLFDYEKSENFPTIHVTF